MRHAKSWTIALIFAIFALAATDTQARGLKGIVKFHGRYSPCETAGLLKLKGCGSCIKDVKKNVTVVIGDTPKIKEDTTVIIKLRGKERFKTMGRVRCGGIGRPTWINKKRCLEGDDVILWYGDHNKAHIVVTPEKPIFERIHAGDKIIIKTRARRAVVEGC